MVMEKLRRRLRREYYTTGSGSAVTFFIIIDLFSNKIAMNDKYRSHFGSR